MEIKIGGASANSDWSYSSLLVEKRRIYPSFLLGRGHFNFLVQKSTVRQFTSHALFHSDKSLQYKLHPTLLSNYNYTIRQTRRYDTIRYDTIRYDTIRYDTIRCDTIRYDTIRYDKKQRNDTKTREMMRISCGYMEQSEDSGSIRGCSISA